LRKPSIKHSLESTSIFVPPGPEEAVPMEIDADASEITRGLFLVSRGLGRHTR
jgi:hypothetical protein